MENFSARSMEKMVEQKRWWDQLPKPLLISGPCSAESEHQMELVAQKYADSTVSYIRAGIWKPRTRPGSFEGIGEAALYWLADLKERYKVKFAVEVANPYHAELAMKFGIDLLWLGARTTVNPFIVQEIANALQGYDKPVLVKNPINPDLALWLGAIERLEKAGIKQSGAIHRGFSTFEESKFRNIPIWQIPLELKSQRPDVLLICDPSHISGNSSIVAEIAQKALDLDYDGLMIESHPNPQKALSDAAQQVALDDMDALLAGLKTRKAYFGNEFPFSELEVIREQIDSTDLEILQLLARRMALVGKIGKYKKENNVAIFQIDRWKKIFRSRQDWGSELGLDPEFVMEILRQIHQASIKKQTIVFKEMEKDSDNFNA
jgi:chorismate mutase